ncbi:uncharacterized protein LOC117335144 [Pecten maximus]|uniref:uncharacterized protein LOC117335144 n=1 Tax=Pecten maximus TaxID=6579 RepID=UPI0014584A2E|nr:uncharacterized protein LOC117335144 [Pecten maximus]
MEGDNFSVTWLCSKLKYDEGGAEDGMISKQLLYRLYEKQCHKHSIKPLCISSVAKIVYKLFPDITNTRVRIGGKNGCNGRRFMFKGISFCGLSHDNIEFITVENLELNLERPCMLSSKSQQSAVILMPANILTNGNMLMKEIILNFSEKRWQLNVRGRSVDLSHFGISDKFDLTLGNLKTILHIVKSLDLCLGCDMNEKRPVPYHILCEHVTSKIGHQDTVRKLRSLHCLGVIGWHGIKSVCSRCRICFDTFISNKKEDKNTVNLDAIGDKVLQKILDAVYPNASPEMKMFLESQHDALNVTDVRKRRWNKEILKPCVSLWKHSPKVYRDLRNSGMFILPSIGIVRKASRTSTAYTSADTGATSNTEDDNGFKLENAGTSAILNTEDDNHGLELKPAGTSPASNTEDDNELEFETTDLEATSDTEDNSGFEFLASSHTRNTKKRKFYEGEQQDKKRKTTEVQWPCGICEKDASVNSVGCNGCDIWYHGDCLQIEDLDNLPDEWFCQKCEKEDTYTVISMV